ncbi:MAG: pectate lyase [Anaerohalosphaeraceae bacterium]
MKYRTTVWVMLMMGTALSQAAEWPTLRLSRYLNREAAWYSSPEALTLADNILTWQDDYGGWPKNVNTASKPYDGNRKDLHGTFDNGATIGELRFLARVYKASGQERYLQAFQKGFEMILKAQYPTGGWPQQYPPPAKTYHRHITFNDNAMVRILVFLKDVSQSEDYSFLKEEQRQAARSAFERGIGCILKCQIRVNGELTGWCAQHDEKDLSPRAARSYELVSLSGGESAEILRLLMRQEDPSPVMVRAIVSGVRWFERSKIEGLRLKWINGRRMAVPDPEAPALWARFYEIDTNRPFFCDRDGVRKYDYNELDPERAEGYAWLGDWGKDVFREFEKWKEKWKDRLAAVERIRIVLTGDSTVCEFQPTDWRRGWGQYLGEYFSDKVEIANHARSGRSTKTFLNEGLWEKALEEKPLFILMQFGHNDNHAPEKPESTAADKEYTDNLRYFVERARAIGATPILITPMHRRKFTPDGRMNDTLKPYADAMKKVAEEKKAALVDLHTASGQLFERLGETEAAKMSDDPQDRTHFNEQGARKMAELIMQQLPQAEPSIKPYLKQKNEQ